MNRLKKKIRSQTGASLTFALLMFLVCAVVGSAVLTAGTAASGRMSKIAESDQRYYSVNSAARLLIEVLEKDEIWFEEESEDDDTGGEEGGEEDGEPATDGEDTEKSYILYKDTEEIGDTDSSLAIDLVRRVLDGDIAPVTLKLEPDEDLGANLAAEITETLSANGDLKITVSNALASEKDKSYTITLYFMNVGGASSFKWKLYDIDSKMPLSESGADTGG